MAVCYVCPFTVVAPLKLALYLGCGYPVKCNIIIICSLYLICSMHEHSLERSRKICVTEAISAGEKVGSGFNGSHYVTWNFSLE